MDDSRTRACPCSKKRAYIYARILSCKRKRLLAFGARIGFCLESGFSLHDDDDDDDGARSREMFFPRRKKLARESFARMLMHGCCCCCCRIIAQSRGCRYVKLRLCAHAHPVCPSGERTKGRESRSEQRDARGTKRQNAFSLPRRLTISFGREQERARETDKRTWRERGKEREKKTDSPRWSKMRRRWARAGFVYVHL